MFFCCGAKVIGTYSLCLSLGVGPFSLRLGANVGSRGTVWPNPGSRGPDSLRQSAFHRFPHRWGCVDPSVAKDRWKKVPCCCWLRLCPAPEGITQALQPACLSRTEIFWAVKNRICGLDTRILNNTVSFFEWFLSEVLPFVFEDNLRVTELQLLKTVLNSNNAVFFLNFKYIGVSKNRGTPQWIVYNGKSLLKWMIWGEKTLFSETSI